MKSFEEQWQALNQGILEITPEEEFKDMLEKAVATNKPLRVKCGIDPTVKDIHLGHLIPYRKMRQFQDLGHTGVVIIGDYTAQIGDPTGKEESRPSLTHEEVKENAKSYLEQLYAVLDPERTEVRYQSEWFEDKTLKDALGWAMQTTVAKLLSHETFRQRLDKNSSLGLHELFYPILQGIDSVYCQADVELGGSDQKFNVLMGRDFQKINKMRPQVAILMPILTGLDGKFKMSKSLNNYIGIHDAPFDKFGKIMSIPDPLMSEYLKNIFYASDAVTEELQRGIQKGTLHPNEEKKKLAVKVVELFHGLDMAQEMRAQFEQVFKGGGIPEDAPTWNWKAGKTLCQVLVENQILSSNSEVRRMVEQKAVSFVDGEKIQDMNRPVDESFKGQTLKVGKRKFLKIL